MAINDLNKAMITYLLGCPIIQSNPIFFNFGNVEENGNQIITLANVTSANKSYVDGTIRKQYKFAIMSYKHISFNPLVKESGYPDENLEAMAAFQGLIDWLKEKICDKEYPDFGSSYPVDEMKLSSDTPNIYDVDETVSPPIVRYSVEIQVDYLDTTKSSWNKPIVSI